MWLVCNNETPIMIGQLNPYNKPLTQIRCFRCDCETLVKRAHKRVPLAVMHMLVLIKNVNIYVNAEV